MIPQLCSRIWKNETFQVDLLALREDTIRTSLGIPKHNGFTLDSLTALLQAATNLASSDSDQHRGAAYDIAAGIFTTHRQDLSGIDELLYLTLARMGNFPALGLFRQDAAPPSLLPLTAKIETLSRRIENSITLTPNRELTFTDFQRGVWNRLVSGDSVSLSAPTSTGKSYVLISFLRKFISSGAGLHAVYIVPTRALINQISVKLLGYFAADGVNVNRVVTVPLASEQAVQEGTVFVLTQERLQVLLQNHPKLMFGVAIIDEAQTIADGPRGVLLQSVLDEILSRNGQTQLFFAAPFMENPDVFSSLFPIDIVPEISTSTAVAQNVILIDVDGADRKRVTFSEWGASETRVLGTRGFDEALGFGTDCLVQLAAWLGMGSQSLLYALGPSECETMALRLRELVPELSELQDARKVLSDFVKEAVHPKYALAETVLRGVGFHYGDMPTLLRKTLEEQFDSGILNYLISTSTLLHGVNLPARSLFLYKPFKGKDRPLGSVDFWNLAGRAGRLGREFFGNVFLVDYGSWDSKPLSGPRRERVVSALTHHVTEVADDLVAYIRDRDRKPEPRKAVDEYEGTLVRLFTDYRQKKLESTLERSGLPPHSEKAERITSALVDVAGNITLPDEVVLASPTVSVHRQQKLYDYFLKRIPQKGPEDFIPIHPLDGQSYGRLLVIIKRLHTYVLGKAGSDQSHKYFAAIAQSWMRGDPIPKIIETSFRLRRTKHPKASLATTIRNVLEEIEDALRFRYVRLTSCYNAVLEYALKVLNLPQIAKKITPLPLYLEIGASSTSMVSLMSLGLSRVSASRLTEFTTRKNMNREESLEWLGSQNLEVLDLSPIMVAEIQAIVAALQR